MVLVGDHRLAVVNLSGGLALFVEGGLAVLVGVFLLVVGGGNSFGVVAAALAPSQSVSALVARDVITASTNVSSASVRARGSGVLGSRVSLTALISHARAEDSRAAIAVAGHSGLDSASASVSVALRADNVTALLARHVSGTSTSGLLGDSVA